MAVNPYFPARPPALHPADETMSLSALATLAQSQDLLSDRDAFLKHMASLSKTIIDGGKAAKPA
eukprot:CAMPEP_0119497244 /NCGR_PEP_ID=MMETSP1344-20130328/20343_1 /TAXON_ID=236787 /ORGANISM="Florenciella parvula, Strain CCMP2471" /LENGTH=63 /DNA_ID=CAMNT_0007533019 /DNA_START=11 /DNA_END=199 /DNA_ORIENTATION=+